MNKIVAYIVAVITSLVYFTGLIVVCAALGYDFTNLGVLWKCLLAAPMCFIWHLILSYAKTNDKEDNKKEEENKEE